MSALVCFGHNIERISRGRGVKEIYYEQVDVRSVVLSCSNSCATFCLT